jgi:hypothetical protein
VAKATDGVLRTCSGRVAQALNSNVNVTSNR